MLVERSAARARSQLLILKVSRTFLRVEIVTEIEEKYVVEVAGT